MKKLHSFVLPAFVASVASLLISGIASADNVFVANNVTGAVTEIAPDGTMSFFVNPSSVPSGFVGPTGISFNTAGDLYVAYNSGGVVEYNPNGTFNSVVATGLSNPRGITFDSAGNLYINNQSGSGGAGSITEIPLGGSAETIVNSTLFPGTLGAPNDLTFDSAGNMYVTAGASNAVDKITFSSPGVVASVTPFITTGLSSPNGIVYDSIGVNAGDFFVVDHGSNTVDEFSSTGVESASPFISLTAADAPKSIAIDSAGNFYVTDVGDGLVTEYGPAGNILNTYSDPAFISGSGSIKTLATVPEPSAYALLLAGLGVLYFTTRRKTARMRV